MNDRQDIDNPDDQGAADPGRRGQADSKSSAPADQSAEYDFGESDDIGALLTEFVCLAGGLVCVAEALRRHGASLAAGRAADSSLFADSVPGMKATNKEMLSLREQLKQVLARFPGRVTIWKWIESACLHGRFLMPGDLSPGGPPPSVN